jgi:hypothetical protein
MIEHSNDRPSPAVLPASESPLRSPLAKLAEIPEEEIWLAKQKSKRTRRAYKLSVGDHFLRDDEVTGAPGYQRNLLPRSTRRQNRTNLGASIPNVGAVL